MNRHRQLDSDPGNRAAPDAGGRLGPVLELLDDPSPTVWRNVRQALQKSGRSAAGALRRTARAGSPRARARARRLLLDQDRERVSRRLLRYALRPDLDLERALLLLSRLEEPGLDVRPYTLALDAMGAEVLRRTESLPPGSRRAAALVEYLANELEYGGDRSAGADYHHPDGVYLHRAIVKKSGLPLTLVAIYLFVARRAGIPAAPVALPGHVVLRLHGPDRNLLVDPFGRRTDLTERECLRYLAARGLTFDTRWFADASDGALFERQVRNLCVSYQRRGLTHEVALLSRVLRARLGARRERSRGAPAEIAP